MRIFLILSRERAAFHLPQGFSNGVHQILRSLLFVDGNSLFHHYNCFDSTLKAMDFGDRPRFIMINVIKIMMIIMVIMIVIKKQKAPSKNNRKLK